ncbi:MAG TPA: (Fe-S)-binding protein [Humidesulfovibrio sp.]|uniref:(Fe-S)-binding protein n=1 Tax=Humidesulfovibrio sp. TaxID=2910988 RepID=UPI002D185458|nr:(Fe-S)-binding protein [Humidesulfovibrio sp.]HWR05043.1 (Fe-S)-binding protein [Humidesulfovibrio sp.]
MHAHLFIPCLVEDCQPETAEAVVEVLERLGVEVRHPSGQTCCGQLAYKTGDVANARLLARRYLDIFAAPGPVVCPSGSCVKMVRTYPELFAAGTEEHARAVELAARTFEFCEFVAAQTSQAGQQELDKLGLHLKVRACYHGSCQMQGEGVAAPRRLLSAIRGLTLVEAERPERCCGFGGVFSLQFTSVSEALVEDKCAEILATKPEIIVSAEPSCLMNISGHMARLGQRLPSLHVAQVLAAALKKETPAWRVK